MYWKDEGYLLSKSNFDENSIIIEAFTLDHGKCSGIVYGGSSKKQKKNLQLGNKIVLNWKSKGENKIGHFSIELVKPITPMFFDDKRRTICILAAISILKILLPLRQINKDIYHTFEKMLDEIKHQNWINLYIFWELLLIKQLGFEINFLDKENLIHKFNKSIVINNRSFKIPQLIKDKNTKKNSNREIIEALIFNKNLFMENFIIPNKLILPTSRKILEKYYI